MLLGFEQLWVLGVLVKASLVVRERDQPASLGVDSRRVPDVCQKLDHGVVELAEAVRVVLQIFELTDGLLEQQPLDLGFNLFLCESFKWCELVDKIDVLALSDNTRAEQPEQLYVPHQVAFRVELLCD